MVEFSIFEKLYDLNAHFRKYGNKHGYLLGTITIFFTIFPISFSTQSHDLVSPAAFKAIPPGATTQGSRSEGVTTPRVVDAVDASQIFPDLPRFQKNSDWVTRGRLRTFQTHLRPYWLGPWFFPYAGNLVMWWTHGGRCLSKIRWFSLFKTRWYRMFQPCLMTGYRTIKYPLNQPSLYPSVEISPVYSTMFP